MAFIGKFNRLRLVKEVDFGVYLDGEELGNVLLPRAEVPEDCQIDDILEVFIYLDSEDRFIATRSEPYIEVDEFAWLKA